MESWVPVVSLIVVIATTFVGVFIAIGRLLRRVEETGVTVAAMTGHLTILRADLNEHKVKVAAEYVTNGDLKDAVKAVTDSIDRLGRDLKDYVTALQRRPD